MFFWILLLSPKLGKLMSYPCWSVEVRIVDLWVSEDSVQSFFLRIGKIRRHIGACPKTHEAWNWNPNTSEALFGDWTRCFRWKPFVPAMRSVILVVGLHPQKPRQAQHWDTTAECRWCCGG